jgi:hypothetical protein
MPRSVVVLSMEEKAAKYDEMIERKRANSKKYYENNTKRFQEYYDANKETIIQRVVDSRFKKKNAKIETNCPGTPEVAII